MIGAIFQHIGQLVEVRINNNICMFKTNEYGGAFVPIDGLKLDKNGVIKEHPDLKDNPEWREEAIERFKNKIKESESETSSINYVIDELSKCGYKPMYLQRQGHRPKRL